MEFETNVANILNGAKIKFRGLLGRDDCVIIDLEKVSRALEKTRELIESSFSIVVERVM